MTIEIKRKAHKQHTIYKTVDGKRVPGCTTITGVLDKPALVYWANNLGFEGIKVREYVDTLAGIGTLTHARIEAEILGIPEDLSEYSAKDIDASDNSMLSWYNWRKGHVIEAAQSEVELVSELYRYGGKLDIVCLLDGVKTLIDIKTGKGLYPDHILQQSGYWWLGEEHNLGIKQAFLLNIPRKETESFDMKLLPTAALREYFQGIFLPCRQIYDAKKALGWK